MSERLPFQNNSRKQENMNDGVKLDQKKSMFANQPPKRTPQEVLESRAKTITSDNRENFSEAYELSVKFNEALDSKIVPENKSFMMTNEESSVISSLTNLAVNINNDENQPYDGLGSISLCALLLKSLLKQRDKYNILDRKYSTLEKRYIELEKKTFELGKRLSSLEHGKDSE